MEPVELEFIGENSLVGVIPNFNHDSIYLISGTIEPFRGGTPLYVPLWLAVHLRQQQKCRIIAPHWMDIDLLEDIKEAEKREATFTKMPSSNYMVEAKLILTTAPEDVPSSEQIKTLIKDIYDVRCAKLRSTVETFLNSEGAHTVPLENVTVFELHTIQPLLPHAMDYLSRMEQTKKALRSNLTAHSFSLGSSSGLTSANQQISSSGIGGASGLGGSGSGVNSSSVGLSSSLASRPW
ncbi:probable DNA replication complex GINS protein PSF2 [Anopheles albimanus]|uniref:Probable DNA replication complex GINS protein PSF2 n=1 Tax=Anopheles albimanus TaxID=7167 RepID=A0A182F350_ANOAL|nr:probable DNA replication complex GINS protein PSF2 [Anopheles albimanus]